MKTLIVEDDMMSQCLLAQVLTKRGHEVVSYDNAELAVLAYQKEFYPLLFVDVDLPGMSGLQFCKWVRAQDHGDKVFIMVATSPGQPKDMGEVLTVGANDFLPKPYDVSALQVRLTIAKKQMDEFFARKELEEALRDSQTSFHRVVKASNEGAWLLNAQFHTDYVSPQMAAIIGYEVEDLANHAVMDFLPESFRRDAEQLFARQRIGEEVKREFQFRRKDGSDCLTFLSAAPVRTEGGEFKGSLWMVADLTGRKSLETELADTRRKFGAQVRVLTGELNQTSKSLQTEFSERKKVEQTLQQMRADLEARLGEQSAERAKVIDALKAEQASKKQAEQALQKAQLQWEARDAQRSEELAKAERTIQAEVADCKRVEAEILRTREDVARRAKEHLAEMLQAGEELRNEAGARRRAEEALQKADEAWQRERAAHPLAEVHSAAFLKLGKELSAARTPYDAARVIAGVAHELVGWDACSFDSYSAEENQIHPVLNIDTVNGRPAEVPPSYLGPGPSPTMRRVIQEGPQLILRSGVSNGHTDYVLFGDRARLSASLMYVAVRAENKVLGFLSVHKYVPEAYGQQDLDTLEALADHCGGALERLGAEEARRQSEERFQLLARATHDVVWDWNLETNRIWWSEAFRPLYGYQSEDLEAGAESWANRIHPEDKERLLNGVQSVIRSGGESWSDEYRFRRSDGAYARVLHRGHLIRNAENKPVRMIGAMADVSQWEQAEPARTGVQARNEAILEAALDAIVTMDHEGKVMEWNPAAETMFGRRRADVLGKDLAELIIPRASREKHCAGLGAFRDEGEDGGAMLGKRVELKAARADGTEFPIEMTVTRIASDGPPIFTGFIRDITERLHIGAQLRQAKKMESIGQLAADLGQDFSILLSEVQSHSSRLMEQKDLPPELAEGLKQIASATERGSQLTRQLLSFSRKQVIHLRKIDLHELINDVGKLLRRAIGESIALQFNYSPSLPAVEADAGLMEEVLMSLAINARDAMPQGGQLTLAIRAVDIDEAYVRHHPEARPGRFVCLTVTDTGCGMDEATLERIFEPYFTTRHAGNGTGLGLATAYGVVKQHQGWIEVQSQVGQGTTFRIFLPVSPKTLAPAPQNGDRHGLRGGTETILVVEDEPAVLNMAKAILQRLGYQVLTAVSGDEALPVWQQQAARIDLLLTDMVMPGNFNGRELAEKLLLEKADLKVLYTSGYSLDLSGPGLATSKNFIFLQKPYHPEVLAQAVRNCLDGKLP